MSIYPFISLIASVPIWATMIPIVACSIISVGVIIERFVYYKKIDFDYGYIMNEVASFLDKREYEKARGFVRSYAGPITGMIDIYLDYAGVDRNIDSKITRHSILTVNALERYVSIIATVATVSPMLGLLGTVSGLLKGFVALYQSGGAGQNASTLLALGVSETLITTVLGLIVAIPSWVFYNYMVARIEHYVKEIEFVSNELLKL